MKAFVAGATGETGRRIVQQLVDRGIPVRALVRDPQAAQAILPAGVELVTGDLMDAESLKTAIADSTVLFSATGARPSFDPTGPYKVDYEGTKNLVEAAKATGIEQFVMVSSLCASQFFHPLNLFWLILVWKKQGEEYIQNSGLTYTIVRPGGLKNEDNADAIVMSSKDTLSEGSIPRTKVAQVCVEAVFQPSARNKIVEIVAKPDAAEKPFEELFAAVA
ncbi:SDR family NAD(P)-dependent oxidoreductase [Phormidesmis priestleyi ULC007]|uniref:SDR family NAD(P)-dependent oxidoreductase n=1 Tax=Phormidesmis priestleyi ULC007 TaxID=1920490 RepID=A0A2T1DCC4_9CYAN|nr:SDR family oxidoreductase [Phormidesmis priestleyi]PSB18116.1 SDR family NAD(P)-dependent oxidoreductase [Phormidesmis priestleyi ULC007]PZO49614.1 MAG: SDR family NAD(P)-dependent oxidoreductase [Phormidesmis priestleyi]